MNLKKTTISNGVQKIGEKAFIDCIMLENTMFPEKLHEIQDKAFQNYRILEELIFTYRIKSIGGVLCVNLGKIYFSGDKLPYFGENAFFLQSKFARKNDRN